MTKIDTLLIRIRQFIASTICIFIGIINLRAQVPVADFTASKTAGCGPLSVSFTDKSSNNPTFWAWDFGNGQISSVQNPNVTYTAPGTYTVTLIAKNSSGAASIVKTDYITVYPFPTARFTSNLQVACAPATVQFTDQSTPGQGSIVSWTWNLGDGQVSNDQNPKHVYTQTGYYNISLNVTNSGGCSISATANRYIRVVPGVQPDFTWSQTSGSCSAPFDITLVNQTAGPGTMTYSWDLGNSTTSTQTNPTTSYPTNDPYTINLTATSSLGCSGSVSKAISFQGGTPVITAPDNACLNVPVTFQNASDPAPVASSWDFGDGTTSTLPNPDKTYAAPGDYTVTLTNTYAGCSSSTTKKITVGGAGAPAAFTADKTGGCKSPTIINFKDQTTGGTGWQWDFGDGTTSTDQNPSHTYTNLGKYNVTLNVTTNTGCISTLTRNQYINLSTPLVNVNAVQGCVGDPVAPTAGIFAPDGVASYEWTAPGATPSTATVLHPTFTYSAQNNYDITFKITTNDGCIASQTFPGRVAIGDKVPAVFTATPTTSCAHQPVTFTSTSSPVDKWLWRFGDGANGTTGPAITHSYADTGFNNVTLIVTNHGCAQQSSPPLPIYISPPLAGFDYKINCTDRHIVTFTDTSEVDPDPAKPVTYLWDFGDGTTYNGQNPPAAHTYPDLNSKTVTLTVTQGSCTDVAKMDIILQPVTPAFTITPGTVCKNSQFTMDASASTPLNAVDSFTWTVNTVTHTFATPGFTTAIPDTGAHVISLVITDKGGCKTPAVTNTVQVTGPAAKLAPGAGGCKNSLITLTDQSTPYRTDAITSWSLDFGDGGNPETFPSLPLTHTYADTGAYDVVLIVTDAKGCTDTARIKQAVKISTATAGFFAKDTVYCPDAPLPFTDSSKGNNLTYSWDFGDGGAGSTDQNPTHAYPADDGQYYSVKLKIKDGAGCTDSVTYNNYIHIQTPLAAFTLEDSAGICIPMQTNFMPDGKYYDSLYWDFGDGSTTTLDTVSHFYNGYGPAPSYAYKAMLILQGAGGCRDTATRNVYVYNPFDPNVSNLTFSPVKQCDSITPDFVLTPPPYTKFTLFFGDGTADSSGTTSLSHTYLSLGAYSPQMILQDSSGCIVARNNGVVTVLGSVPIFTADKKNMCDNGSVNFQGIVISNDGQSNLTWDFGDGNTLTEPTPLGRPDDPFLTQAHSYTTPGIRLAKLIVTTNSGCNETYMDTIHIWQTPHPVITMEGPLCTGLIQFHGGVTTPDIDSVSYAWTFSNGANSGSKDPYLQFPPGPLTAKLTTSVAFGCSDNTSQDTTIFPLPEITGPKIITTPVSVPVTLPFTYSTNVNTWAWSPSTYLDCTDCANPVSTPVFNTTYTITATDENHCTSIDTVMVKTLCGEENYFVPNTFSPNNDGLNDFFYPRGKGLHDIQSMRIFNRWGQMVFERKNFPANSASMGWDGTINGRPAPSDAYVYIIEVICNNAQVVALKGDVTLIR